MIAGGSNGWNIEGNTITGVNSGIYLSQWAHTGTITGNTITNLTGSSSWNGAAVVLDADNTNVSITGNTFSSNATGVYVNSGSTDSAGTVIENNSFLSNTVQANNTSSTTYDFSPNWWGTASGTEIVASLSGSSAITFEPWYADASMTATSSFGLDTGTTTGTSTPPTSTSSLQAMLDAATSGEVINVAPGTYEGSLLINTQVTLQGTCDASGTPQATIVGDAGQAAISIDGAGHVVIDCLNITSTSSAGTEGVVELQGVSGTVVTNNHIHGFTGSGVKIGSGSNDFQISGNTITDTVTGIYLNTSHTGQVTNNTIDNLITGITIIGDNPNVDFSGNTISNNDLGFHVLFNSGFDVAGLNVEGNSLLNNTVQVNNENTATVDFSPNWWGTASGTLIQLSIGTSSVTFDPWYIDATMTATGTFSTGTSTGGGGDTGTTTATSSGALVAAINNATSGDIINVAPGTYHGSLYIDTPITLQGTCNASGTPQATIVGDAGDYAIKIDGAGHVVIDCLNITSTSSAGIGGVAELQSVSGTTVTNNHIFGFNGPAMTVATNSNDFIITGNTITNVDSGIWLNHGAHHGTIHGNHVSGLTGGTGSDGAALVFVGGNVYIDVSHGNIFEDNAIGFFVFSDFGTDDSGTMFRNNSFLNNTAQVTNTNVATYDMRLNWWGTASGTEIMASMGTSSIDFDPWYLDATMTATGTFGIIPETPTPTSTQTVVSTSTFATTTVSGGVVLEIGSNGLIVTGPLSWNGVFLFPVATTDFTVTTASGTTATNTLAVVIGSASTPLTFDNLVKITFLGKAGYTVGWSNASTTASSTFSEITTTCNSSTTPTNLSSNGDCKLNSGSDLVVFTNHGGTLVIFQATTTATSTATSTNNGNNGNQGTVNTGTGVVINVGGGPASVGSAVAGGTGAGLQVGIVAGLPPFTNNVGVPIPLGPFNPLGQVLGSFISQADTTNQNLGSQVSAFIRNLRMGMRGEDVRTLQLHLRAKGYMKAQATGYFGVLTKAAVVKWQRANGLPATGFFGLMSRAKINAELGN